MLRVGLKEGRGVVLAVSVAWGEVEGSWLVLKETQVSP